MDGKEYNMTDHGGEALAKAVEAAYGRGQTDYSMEPLVHEDDQGQPVGTIKPGDAVIFCCRRGEREIELTDMFTDPHFSAVDRKFIPDLDFSILTLYHEKYAGLPVAFAPEQVDTPLAQVISDAGKTQLHCAESEKYAHVTFFLNGGRNEPFPGETDVRIPSPAGIPFDQVPRLSLKEVADAVIDGMGKHDFTVVNFANGDVIGHTSSKEAKLEAAAFVSIQLQRVVEAALSRGVAVLITADHGNIETLYTDKGAPHVAHTTNKVPLFVLDKRQPECKITPLDGALCDVAPTVLHALGLKQPACMTGRTLTPDHDYGPDRQVLLVILDGWGFGKGDDGDAIHLADTPYWDALLTNEPYSRLDASGSFVGLCAGKTGNSEAGHMNIGAGRVVPQDDLRLEAAVQSGTFAQNAVFRKQMASVKARGATLHLLSYLTHASSHGDIAYPLALTREAAQQGLDPVLHIIFDGRSTPPGSAPALLRELEQQLAQIGAGRVADGVCRGLALDRAGNYDKVKCAYDAMTLGEGVRYR